MPKALVIGGGVAGMATAIALRHAGVDAAVYESRPAGADELGAFLTIMANGLDALHAIDADHPVPDVSFVSTEVHMRNGRGRGLGVLAVPSPGPAFQPRTMRRADLYRLLSEEAVRRGVPVAYGKQLAGAEQDVAGRVTALFADGSKADGDLLVGADGIHSITRGLIDPTGPRPVYSGWNIVFGAVRCQPDGGARDRYYMSFGRRASCGHITSPDGETWWFANVPGPEGDLTGATPARLRQRLLDLFAGDSIATVAAIAATDDTKITATGCYELPSIPVWSRAGMTLAGDALHVASPVTTQGASMAIEDAVTLAKCVRDLPDVPAAFRTYEGLRRARVERVVGSGARRLGPRLPSPLRRLIRDLAIARRTRRPDADWLYLHHIDWASSATDDLAALRTPGD